MSEYIEDCNNPVYQVFNEFSSFINSIIIFHFFSDKMIKNIALDAMRVYIRALVEFFEKKDNAQNESRNDNLFYSDFIDIEEDLSVKISQDVRQCINKETAHLSKKRGTLNFDNNKYNKAIKDVLYAIFKFMESCKTSLKSEYKNNYNDNDVSMLIQDINNKVDIALKCIISMDESRGVIHN